MHTHLYSNRLRHTLRFTAVLLLVFAVVSCVSHESSPASDASADVEALLKDANERLLRLSNEANQAGWVQQTYITQDTEALSARADQAFVTAITDYAKKAARLDGSKASPEAQRQLTLLRNTLTMAAPADTKEAGELTQTVTSMGGTYGRGKYCPQGTAPDKCLDIEQITEILAKERPEAAPGRVGR